MMRREILEPDDLHGEWHDACLETGAIHVQVCTDCGTHRHPPRWLCAECHSGRYELTPLSGLGAIYSAATTHFSVDPSWKEKTPYVSVIVELDEGPRVVGELCGIGPQDVSIGRRVRVDVESRREGSAYFVVRPNE